VVLMDLRMPGTDGAEATTRIVVAHPRVRVLVPTPCDTESDVLGAVEAGRAATCSRMRRSRTCGVQRGPPQPGRRCWRPPLPPSSYARAAQ
jgi:DNA-binding NarL/FixJ family response regulator